MEFPLVSIIVPMYNTAGCIARCVKSICAQTYKSIEILLLTVLNYWLSFRIFKRLQVINNRFFNW